MTEQLTPRDFRAHVQLRAETATPSMRSGLHDSVNEFFAVTRLHADVEAPFEKFEPSPGNEWSTAGYAAAVAYRPDSSAPAGDYPFALAVYVEGDVTRYRFQRFEDAVRAGRLWSAGPPARR